MSLSRRARGSPRDASRPRACLALVGTCALWGLSFPATKTLVLHLAALDPGVSTWFAAATTLVVRFGSSAALLALFGWRRPTGGEWRQGSWLGLFTGAGMFF